MENSNNLEEEVIKRIRLAIGSEIPDSEIHYALKQFGNDVDAAIDYILLNSLDIVKRTVTSTGFRVLAQVKEEPNECEAVVKVKEERVEPEIVVRVMEEPKEGEVEVRVKEEPFVDMELGCEKVSIEKVVKQESAVGVKEQSLVEENTNQESEMEVEKKPSVEGNTNQEAVMAGKEEKPIVEDVANRGSEMEVEEKPLVEENTNQEAAVAVKEEKPIVENAANQETEMEVEEKSLVEENTNQEAAMGVKEEKPNVVNQETEMKVEKPSVEEPVIAVKEEQPMMEEVATHEPKIVEKKESPKVPENVREMTFEEYLAFRNRAKTEKKVKEENVNSNKETVESVRPSGVEDGDFPEDPDWYLVGRTIVTGLSTTKGRKLVDNEIVHFVFPTNDNYKYRSLNPQWIVRFSTKRFGEIGRLPMEWGKCVIPLVLSNKVRIFGRCVAAPPVLHMMQEIMVYVSFYIHRSLFTVSDNSTWRLDAPANIDSTVYPLITLFKLLKIIPYQQADFTPEELASRKRSLNLQGNADEGTGASLPVFKRARGCQVQQHKDEQAISEASLNKLVGAVDTYNLEEMEPPATLMCDLRPYQKQALFWMSECEKGVDAEEAAKTLHPCWAAYRICDERASSIYLNMFSGEAATKFPTAMETARGGILADAMGLGKTVMTIALILARRGKGSSDVQQNTTHNRDPNTKVQPKPKGGTLIVCPMALLGQWKDELETHSQPDSISVFVHYGGDRTNDPRALSGHDVVLTTYGVLTAAYKSDREYSIYHRIEWHRVVLDEAHTIKSWKTMGAQAAFTLTAHCRWCLTGTPLQNNLEDLYSLLCFLHVEPWCNWAWWSKLIQRPYENGDQRGLKLIKAILRPLMLRRSKETKDKEGRPILVLPPTDVRVIQCEQSEAEHDFYDALFKRSKVQFDQFVAQGKVLHNYANILELLLRLRQCCNHPFLVMSRADSQYSDLNNFARRFMEANADSATSGQKGQSRAYIEEVVEDIRRGENTECPICMESADDPILTPCAHRMCRECLLSSWRTPTTGLCPICRTLLKKTDLITCPTENKFRIDVEKNWKESSKVSKLLECLEQTRRSGSGEKSIVFSQWTSFLDLLEIPLKRRGIGFLRFDGKLAQKNREKVLKEFNETSEKMVLLMSLRAGGVGLNLTAASNVYLVDPWWNPAVEEQAIMRIHRIGQKRTVRVRRFIVKDTVEERMQQVQAKKQRMIAGALTDEEVRSARLEELKMLFR